MVVVTHPPQIQWVSQFPDCLSLEYHNVYLFPSMLIDLCDVYHDFIRISQSLLLQIFPGIFHQHLPDPHFSQSFPSFPGGSASPDLRGRPVGQCLQPSSSTRAADPGGRGLAAEPCRRHGRYQQHGVDLAVGGGGEPGVDETARWGADSQIRRELEVKIGELFILILDGQVVVDEDLELYHVACGCLWCMLSCRSSANEHPFQVIM